MEKLKKLTAVILAAVMVLSMSTAAFAGTSASNAPITEIIYLSSWNSVIKKKNNYYYEPTTQKSYLWDGKKWILSSKKKLKVSGNKIMQVTTTYPNDDIQAGYKEVEKYTYSGNNISKIVEYDYDPEGELYRKYVDKFTYNDKGRITKVTQKTYLYNNGQIELTDKSSVKYTYYKSGNLKTMTEKVEGSRTVTKCTYNKNGKLKKISDSNGASYIYKNGKLIQYTAGNDYKILYKTNSAGNVTQAAFYYDDILNSKEIHKYKYYKKKYVSTEIVYTKRSGSSKTKESKVVNSGFVKIYSTIPTTTSEVCY